ncbi:MAG: hypothetical protein GY822_26135 [Deltaproteobacteria bacterium]|nr:hypothetical protein [Deltaproteobacteria bacterium]
MKPYKMLSAFVLAGALLCSVNAVAQDKADPFSDLFGAAPAPAKGLEELKKATESVKVDGAKKGLALKKTEVADLVHIEFGPLEVARLMRKDPKKGCVAWGNNKEPLAKVVLRRLPGKSPTFFTCVSGTSKIATQTQVRLEVQGPRKRRVGQAAVVLSFDGKNQNKAIMEWPALELGREGQYTLVYEVAGKVLARQPLFVVEKAPPED